MTPGCDITIITLCITGAGLCKTLGQIPAIAVEMIIREPIIYHTPGKIHGCRTCVIELVSYVECMCRIRVEPGIIACGNTQGIVPIHLHHRRAAEGMVHHEIHYDGHTLLMTGIHKLPEGRRGAVYFVGSEVKIGIITPAQRAFEICKGFDLDSIYTK